MRRERRFVATRAAAIAASSFVSKRQAKALWACQLAASLAKAIKVRQRLDKDDKRALHDYTSNGYGVINRASREGTTDDAIRGRINAVIRALVKLSKKRRGTTAAPRRVYRRTTFTSDMIQELKVGGTFVDKAFLSTSTNEERYAVGGWEGSVVFLIESKTGVDVKKYSHHPEEDEILFLPGTTFRITKIGKGKLGETVVTMKEMV